MDNAIKIESGIPLSSRVTYPQIFRKMKVGDSFAVFKSNRSIRSIVSHFSKKYPEFRFVVGKDPQNNDKIRVWRVEIEKTQVFVSPESSK